MQDEIQDLTFLRNFCTENNLSFEQALAFGLKKVFKQEEIFENFLIAGLKQNNTAAFKWSLLAGKTPEELCMMAIRIDREEDKPIRYYFEGENNKEEIDEALHTAIKYLLENKLDPGRVIFDETTLLHTLAKDPKHLEILKSVVSKHPDLINIAIDGTPSKTPLHEAILSNNLKAVVFLTSMIPATKIHLKNIEACKTKEIILQLRKLSYQTNINIIDQLIDKLPVHELTHLQTTCRHLDHYIDDIKEERQTAGEASLIGQSLKPMIKAAIDFRNYINNYITNPEKARWQLDVQSDEFKALTSKSDQLGKIYKCFTTFCPEASKNIIITHPVQERTDNTSSPSTHSYSYSSSNLKKSPDCFAICPLFQRGRSVINACV